MGRGSDEPDAAEGAADGGAMESSSESSASKRSDLNIADVVCDMEESQFEIM